MNHPISDRQRVSQMAIFKYKKTILTNMCKNDHVLRCLCALTSKHHAGFQSTIAQQLCVQPGEDKSREDRMGSMCSENFLLSSNCYISAHVSQTRLLACFLHGHNVKHIFSERLACGEPGEPGNSWWRRIRSGPGEWSRLGRAASGPGEKSSAALHTSSLTHSEKNPHRPGDKWNFTMFCKSAL